MSGHFYGLGVGPGDPDLLTLKAAKVLHEVDIIIAASSTKNENSLALDIARPHLGPQAKIIAMGFPMSQDPDILTAAWEKNARLILEHLNLGQRVAFLTLGDPLLYSTFGYVLRTLRAMAPEQKITIIPGITSFQAAAAATETILAKGKENLLILPGIREAQSLRTSVAGADNAVILKAYTNFTAIREELKKFPVDNHCVFVSKVGMKEQLVTRDLNQAPEKPTYLSLILLTQKT